MRDTSAYSRECTPFRIGDGPSRSGPRLGGMPPAGVMPTGDVLRYFLTVPLFHAPASGTMVSVFSDPSDRFLFGGNAGRILGRECKGIEVSIHPDAPRTDSSSHASTLTPHPIRLESSIVDVQDEEGMVVPRSGHKLDGAPYLVQRAGRLAHEVRVLAGMGFRQCLQIDFPGADDSSSIAGDWPFGTAIFHVLLRPTGGEHDWRCFWEV